MGPRLLGRGELLCRRAAAAAPGAFNGAAAVRPRRGCVPCVVSGYTRMPSTGPRLLGRGEHGADPRAPQAVDPSMGPRLLGRGEDVTLNDDGTVVYLQWGRGC